MINGAFPATDNILSRVTGGEVSNIFGTIKTTNFGNANLFLLNPAGVVFGPNASLDIGGSFMVTNADALKFADGKLFTAKSGPDDAVLSVATPVALEFLGPRPDSQGIQFNGSNLAVSGSLDIFGIPIPGTGTISVVGRDGDTAKGVQVTGGSLAANSGQIKVASVASEGALTIDTLEKQANGNGDTFSKLGQISLEQGASINATGNESDIVIRGGALELVGASSINSSTENFSATNAGDISITIGSLDIQSGSQVNNSTGFISSGNGGKTDIVASSNISLAGHNASGTLVSGIFTNTRGSGDAGALNITAPQFQMSDGAELGGSSADFGKPGNITVSANTISITGGSQIIARSLFNFGEGSIITLRGLDSSGADTSPAQSIVFSGVSLFDGRPSGIFNNALFTRDAGKIFLAASSLTLENGATLGGSTSSFGNAADISITSSYVDIKNGASINTETIPFSSGNAGNISIDSQQLTIQSARITSTSFGSGNAGSITLQAEQSLNIMSNTIVESAIAGGGTGGRITLNTDRLTVSGMSGIFTTGGFFNDFNLNGIFDPGESFIQVPGNSGDIIVQGAEGVGSRAQMVEITDFSALQTRTFGPGNAGNISVVTDSLLIRGKDGTQQTGITASSSIFRDQMGTKITAAVDINGNPVPRMLTGKAGDVDINASGVVAVSNVASIEAITEGEGTAGKLTVQAGELVVSGQDTFIKTTSFGSGNAGDVQIAVTGSLTVEGGAQLQSATKGSGNAGNLTVTAQNATVTGIGPPRDDTGEGFASGLFVNSESPGTDAQAGNLNLTVTDALTISDGGGIFGITKSKGDGANVTVTAGNVNLESGGAIATSTFGSGDDAGNAGTITVEATAGPINISGTLDTNRPIEPIRRGISKSGIFSKASVDPDPDTTTGIAPNKNAGFITVTTPNSILLTNQAEISTSAEGSGNGGTITLTAGNNAEFTNNSKVSSVNTGSGDAGGITVKAVDTILVDDSTFTVESAQANAGNIKFDAGFLIHLIDSTLSGSTGGGPETSGANINLDPDWVVIQNSQLLANAFEGQGGNITLQADLGIFVDEFSTISASSQFGTSGSVNIQAPIQNLSGAIAPLPENIVDIAALVGQHCAAQKGGQLSSFVQGGRDVVPPGPTDFLTSPLFLEPLQQGKPPGVNGGMGSLTAKQIGMGFGQEWSSIHLVRMTDSSGRAGCYL